MTGRDVALASMTSVIWGLAFVAVKFALQSFSAPELTAVRFLIACVPALAVPRPKLPWRSIVLIGLTLFTGQFLLLFFAYTRGLPPGLASVTQQTQAFFTVLLAAIFLREMPSARQWTGMTVAFAGLALIALTVGSDFTAAGLALGLGAALSWAVGNVLVKGTAGTPIFPLVVWASLIPPVPSLIVAAAYRWWTRSPMPRGRASSPRSIWDWSPPSWPTRSGAPCCSGIRPPSWRRLPCWRPAPASRHPR
jgi:O-acetylserine/cysteine efflux transporter